MSFPVRHKWKGFVEDIDGDTIWARVFPGRSEFPAYQAEIDRNMFIERDRNRLQMGSYISLPKRRDRKWMLTPIPVWTEAKARRVRLRAEREARALRKQLFTP